MAKLSVMKQVQNHIITLVFQRLQVQAITILVLMLLFGTSIVIKSLCLRLITERT